MRFGHRGSRSIVRVIPVLLAMLFAMPCIVFAAPPSHYDLVASPEPSVYGQPFTLTATLIYGGVNPYTSPFTFSIDGTVVGVVNGPISSSVVSFTVTTAAIISNLTDSIYLDGPHTITVSYPGDGITAPFTVSATHVVVGQPTTSTITSLDQNIYYGQEIGYDNGVDAVLNAQPANATYYGSLNDGELTTYIGSTVVCAISYGTGGRCPDGPFEGYSAGTYDTYVVYAGNDYFAGSTSPYYSVTVAQDSTSTAVPASSANPAIFAQTLTLTTTVTASYPGAIAGTVFPTVAGTVQFFDGTSSIGTATLNAQGTAALAIRTLAIGTHQLTACYVNSLNFAASCSPVLAQTVTLPITPVNTVTLLTSSLNPSLAGQTVIFTATVETTGAILQTPAGSLSFYDGTALLQTILLNAQGVATFTTSTLAAGIHPITAVYAGNAATAGSTSAVLQQVVLTSLTQATGYRLIVTPTSLSVGVGGSVTVGVAVVGVNPSGQPFQLGCSQLPNETACTFGQTMLPANGGSTTLTIATTAPHACGASTPYFTATNTQAVQRSKSAPLLALAGLLGLSILGMRRRVRSLRALLLGLLLCALAGSGTLPLTGCGGCTDLGTQPLQYGFLVNATAAGGTSTTVSQAVYLNVHL